LPTTAPTTNNYVVHGAGALNVDDTDVKIDFIPSQRSTIFGRYSISRSHIFDPPALGPADGDATNGGQLGNADSRIQSVGLGGTYTFTPNLLADWNLGWGRQRLTSGRLSAWIRWGFPAPTALTLLAIQLSITEFTYSSRQAWLTLEIPILV